MSAPHITCANPSQTPPCPVCGGSSFHAVLTAADYEYQLPGTFHVGTCVSCGLLQQTPRPPFEQILAYYAGYHLHAAEPVGATAKLKSAAIEWPRLRRYRALAPTGARVLDIGCGRGDFLALLRRTTNWSLHGTEPVAEAAAAGIARGLSIVPATLRAAAFGRDSFDLAIMHHVLEHVPDPASELKEVARIVKPGGFLCGEVPTPGCAERWLFGRYWAGYHLPRHLYFFRPTQLHRLLQHAGFEEISIHGKMQPANLVVSLHNLLRDRWPALAHRSWIGEDSFLCLAASTPIAVTLRVFGSAPTLRFTCRRGGD